MREQERTKYERIWDFPQYRKNSPGERLVDDAIERMGMKSGTVIDFGCDSAGLAGVFSSDLWVLSHNCLPLGFLKQFLGSHAVAKIDGVFKRLLLGITTRLLRAVIWITGAVRATDGIVPLLPSIRFSFSDTRFLGRRELIVFVVHPAVLWTFDR
jgi:hypothetical protein